MNDIINSQVYCLVEEKNLYSDQGTSMADTRMIEIWMVYDLKQADHDMGKIAAP